MDCSPPGSSAMGLCRQEHWSGLPFPSPGDLPDPGLKLKAAAWLLYCRQILHPWATWEAPKKANKNSNFVYFPCTLIDYVHVGCFRALILFHSSMCLFYVNTWVGLLWRRYEITSAGEDVEKSSTLNLFCYCLLVFVFSWKFCGPSNHWSPIVINLGAFKIFTMSLIVSSLNIHFFGLILFWSLLSFMRQIYVFQ